MVNNRARAKIMRYVKMVENNKFLLSTSVHFSQIVQAPFLKNLIGCISPQDKDVNMQSEG